jgi:hypothetical protein
VRRLCVSEVQGVIRRPQKYPIKCGEGEEGDLLDPRTVACDYECMLLLLAPLRTRCKMSNEGCESMASRKVRGKSWRTFGRLVHTS